MTNIELVLGDLLSVSGLEAKDARPGPCPRPAKGLALGTGLPGCMPMLPGDEGLSAALVDRRLNAIQLSNVPRYFSEASARVFISNITPPGARQKKRDPRSVLSISVSM